MKGKNSAVIEIDSLYADTAKLSDLDLYVQKTKDLAGEGNEVILTGAGPVWLYLKIAHALHGKARKLIYKSPGLKDETNEEGEMVIFDHNSY
jgi:CRISPR-associated protein Csx3